MSDELKNKFLKFQTQVEVLSTFLRSISKPSEIKENSIQALKELNVYTYSYYQSCVDYGLNNPSWSDGRSLFDVLEAYTVIFKKYQNRITDLADTNSLDQDFFENYDVDMEKLHYILNSDVYPGINSILNGFLINKRIMDGEYVQKELSNIRKISSDFQDSIDQEYKKIKNEVAEKSHKFNAIQKIYENI